LRDCVMRGAKDPEQVPWLQTCLTETNHDC
jgi:hypothetical protein